MAENAQKAKKVKNFHVRFRDDQAEWLHDNLKPHRNVPEKVRNLVDREKFRQELANENQRKKPKK